MGVEWIAGTLIVLAVACVIGATVLFLGASWLVQWLRGTAGVLLVVIAGYFVLFSASLFSYQQVSGVSPLATVSFERNDVQNWAVTVAEANGNRRQFNLLGDLWQLDVRLLRYAGPLSAFGANPLFQLEQLSGRYITMEDQQEKDRSEFRLSPGSFLGYDLWTRVHEGGSLMIDASRSSLVLVPIADGAIYEVRLDERGLALAAANSVAEDALRRLGD